MNSTGMNLHINPLSSKTTLKTNNSSMIEDTLSWLEAADSPGAKFFGKGICSITGLYFIAQIVRLLFL